METNANINSLVNYPIVSWTRLPGSDQDCLVIAKSEASKHKYFDSWLIGYAKIDVIYLSLDNLCKGLEFRDFGKALSCVNSILNQGW